MRKSPISFRLSQITLKVYPPSPSFHCHFIPHSGRCLYLYSFVSLLSVLYSVPHAIHSNLLLMPLGDGFFFQRSDFKGMFEELTQETFFVHLSRSYLNSLSLSAFISHSLLLSPSFKSVYLITLEFTLHTLSVRESSILFSRIDCVCVWWNSLEFSLYVVSAVPRVFQPYLSF